jgi:uncharacterized membrane protein YhaH (DUF805 family)
MGIQEAVIVCFTKYVAFEGRATRPEYWWWFLFVLAVSVILQIAGSVALGADSGAGGVLSGLFTLVVLLPGLAVGVRRLHDTDRSGWWLLFALVPVIGYLVLLYFMVQPGTPGPNRFGNGAPVMGLA